MSDNKIKFSISMEPDLVQQIEEIAQLRGEGRATVIERICRNGVDAEFEFLKDMENPVTRGLFNTLAKQPKVLQALAKLVGENLDEQDMQRIADNAPKHVARGRKRQERKS